MRMHFHKTPQEVVKLARKHVPRTATKILEPAVGEGALLEALYPSQLHENLTLVDIDSRRLDAIKFIYPELSAINADFTTWSPADSNLSFDLIITNPPFSGRTENWMSIGDRRAPIEYIFFRKCIELLLPGGTLIAIVPDTIVNSTRLLAERAWIFSQGAITFAYQLPERIFDKIEGAFYLLVFKKGATQRVTKLRSLAGHSDILLSLNELSSSEYRLDHSYYRSKQSFIHFTPESAVPLSSFCEIARGPIRENYKAQGNIHSNSFLSHCWRNYVSGNSSNCCIAVKRVSRNAHLSFGLFPLKDIQRSTDCIVFIRTKSELVLKTLFFLRVLLASEDGESLLLKGAGAKFIQVTDLKNLAYFNLADQYPEDFKKYIASYYIKDFSTCRHIERSIYAELTWGKKITLLQSTASIISIEEVSDGLSTLSHFGS